MRYSKANRQILLHECRHSKKEVFDGNKVLLKIFRILKTGILSQKI